MEYFFICLSFQLVDSISHQKEQGIRWQTDLGLYPFLATYFMGDLVRLVNSLGPLSLSVKWR